MGGWVGAAVPKRASSPLLKYRLATSYAFNRDAMASNACMQCVIVCSTETDDVNLTASNMPLGFIQRWKT